MRTLGIVGASGAVGRAVVAQLLACDESLQIVALLRKADAELAEMDRCDVIDGGVFDSCALERAVKNCDVIVNLAARNPVGPEEDWAAREDFFLLNVLGAGLVAGAAQRHRLPVIHFSTVAIYEAGAYVAGRPMTEKDSIPCSVEGTFESYDRMLKVLSRRIMANRTHASTESLVNEFKEIMVECPYPRSTPIYGLSKLVGETLVLDTCSKVCCIRMSDVYGPSHESRGVIIDHLKQLSRPNSLSVDLGPRKGIYFIFIDDVARFLRLLVDRLLSGGDYLPRVINFCGERVDSAGMRSHLREVCAARRIGCAIEIVSPESPQIDRRYSSDVFRRSFPEFEKTDFGAGLNATVDALSGVSTPLGAGIGGVASSPTRTQPLGGE